MDWAEVDSILKAREAALDLIDPLQRITCVQVVQHPGHDAWAGDASTARVEVGETNRYQLASGEWLAL